MPGSTFGGTQITVQNSLKKIVKNVLTIGTIYYIINNVLRTDTQHNRITCGCSSVVEHQPSKLDMWVRFPSPALMREWLSWWSATLPRSRPRVRVPSRALFYFLKRTDISKRCPSFCVLHLSMHKDSPLFSQVLPAAPASSQPPDDCPGHILLPAVPFSEMPARYCPSHPPREQS